MQDKSKEKNIYFLSFFSTYSTTVYYCDISFTQYTWQYTFIKFRVMYLLERDRDKERERERA